MLVDIYIFDWFSGTLPSAQHQTKHLKIKLREMLKILLLITGAGRKEGRCWGKQLTMHFYDCSKITPSLRFPSQLFYTASVWFWFLSSELWNTPTSSSTEQYFNNMIRLLTSPRKKDFRPRRRSLASWVSSNSRNYCWQSRERTPARWGARVMRCEVLDVRYEDG